MELLKVEDELLDPSWDALLPALLNALKPHCAFKPVAVKPNVGGGVFQTSIALECLLEVLMTLLILINLLEHIRWCPPRMHWWRAWIASANRMQRPRRSPLVRRYVKAWWAHLWSVYIVQ